MHARRTRQRRSNVRAKSARTWFSRGSALGLLLIVAASAHAATVYRCRDASGHTSFQGTPCTNPAQQTRQDVAGQPLIDPAAPRTTAADTLPPRATARRMPRAVRKHDKPATSWECRAADGEVFYRHTRCPSSVPGDGVVRDNYESEAPRLSSRRRHTAWSPIRVHGVKVTRADACANINGVAASGRDGHERDANVSVYAHLMGRDPCAGY